MEVKTKTVTLEVKAVGDEGSFEAYGSAFGNIDSYGDVVVKGAFEKTLKERKGKIRLLWQHKSDQPIGIFTEMYEDNNGLVVKGKLFLDVQQGKEAYVLLKGGAIDSMSIGYSTVKEDFDAKDGIRYLKEVKLYEVSLVTFPANEMAVVTSVKSEFESLTEGQRKDVLAYIQQLKNPSLDRSDEPQIKVCADLEEHSEETKADTNKSDEPLDEEVLHSLEKLIIAMKGEKKNKEVKHEYRTQGSN